jgi:hypothetical protein
MDKERRQEPQRRAERQGTGLREKRGDELEAAATRRRVEARLFLRSNEWHEEEVNVGENGERPKLPD